MLTSYQYVYDSRGREAERVAVEPRIGATRRKMKYGTKHVEE